jgi:Protein of unknown function (DUF3775)
MEVSMMRDSPVLTISPEKVCFVITQARRLARQDEETEAGPAANDRDVPALVEDRRGTPAGVEFSGFIRSLSRDELIDLVALVWLGRGDSDLDGWSALRAEAERSHNDRTAGHLLGTPCLADYLTEALLQFGRSYEDFEPALR